MAALGDTPLDTEWPAGGGASPVILTPPVFKAWYTGNSTRGAGDILYVPCTAPGPCEIAGIMVGIQTQAGNLQVGLYEDDAGAPGARVVASGSVACPAAALSVIIPVTPTAIDAGRYWAACVGDDGGLRFYYHELLIPTGTASATAIPQWYGEASATLPATAAATVVAHTVVYGCFGVASA